MSRLTFSAVIAAGGAWLLVAGCDGGDRDRDARLAQMAQTGTPQMGLTPQPGGSGAMDRPGQLTPAHGSGALTPGSNLPGAPGAPAGVPGSGVGHPPAGGAGAGPDSAPGAPGAPAGVPDAGDTH